MQWDSAPLIEKAVKESGFDVTEVVCGMAKGADRLGKMWAEWYGKATSDWFPNWAKYGKAAGPIRNKQMAEYADAAIVFIWDGSRGSADMIKQMADLNKPCFVVKDGQL